MNRAGLLAALLLIAPIAGCISREEELGPLHVEVTSFTIHDPRNVTLNVSATNTGSTILRHIEIWFVPHVLQVGTNHILGSGSVQNRPSLASKNFIPAHVEIPPGGIYNFNVEIQYDTRNAPQISESEFYSTHVFVEAQDETWRWEWRNSFCYSSTGEHYESGGLCWAKLGARRKA